MGAKVRLDKWLWAARFYKTRSQSTEGIKGGKVDIDGQRAKPSHKVNIGATIEVRKGPYRFTVEVLDLAEKRGNAEMAARLYREDPESIVAREEISARVRAERAARPKGWEGGRPTKKQRRDLLAFQRTYYRAPEDIDEDDL